MDGLGERLRRLRKGKGMSLRALGEKVHLSHTFISDIEQGRSKPSVDTLVLLAEALNVSVAELITESTPPTEDTIKQIMELSTSLSPRAQKELAHYAQFLYTKQIFEGNGKESSATSEETA